MAKFTRDSEYAEYMEVKRNPNKYDNLPATLDSLTLVRHDLLKNKPNELISTLQEELNVDKELGLDNQAKITASKSLKNDIDELTTSNDYFEVSKDLLKTLFQVPSLQAKCFFYNIISALKGFFSAGALPLSLHGLMIIMLVPLTYYASWLNEQPDAILTYLMKGSCVLGFIGEVFLLAVGISTWFDRKIEYDVLNIDLKIIPLEDVSDEIPYGAKLKVLEAKKSNIFEDFVYAKPEFFIERKIINMPVVDPAILGVTRDKRMYMIVYWDIDKDVEKVVKQIEHFKKFKLNKV